MEAMEALVYIIYMETMEALVCIIYYFIEFTEKN